MRKEIEAYYIRDFLFTAKNNSILKQINIHKSSTMFIINQFSLMFLKTEFKMCKIFLNIIFSILMNKFVVLFVVININKFTFITGLKFICTINLEVRSQGRNPSLIKVTLISLSLLQQQSSHFTFVYKLRTLYFNIKQRLLAKYSTYGIRYHSCISQLMGSVGGFSVFGMIWVRIRFVEVSQQGDE